jgi:hypothetical protein
MKKIIVAFDRTNFSKGAFDFVKKMNETEPVFLIGLFLPQAAMASKIGVGGNVFTNKESQLIEKEEELVHINVKNFEQLCKQNKIEYRIHVNFEEYAVAELKKETGFANLMVLGSETFFHAEYENICKEYLLEILHESECSVIVVPETFEYPDNVILLYDGSVDSVFSIKEFSYLFPELTKRETLLIYVDQGNDLAIPENIQIEELVTSTFSNITFLTLDFDPKKYLTTWLMEKKSSILVCGSYGRSELSMLLKKSFLQDVLTEHILPVFISHK